jgi:hypothetical protein
MSWARVHAWLAIALVSALVIWSVTGLLFHLKPGWDRAYDMLSIDRGGAREELDTAIGPLVRVDGMLAERGPLTEDEARALAVDAVSRSRHRAAYGEPTGTTVTDAAVKVRFSGGPVVTVDRAGAWISQRGPDTDRIDWLYRIHYLQLTGHRSLDRAIAVAGLLLIWAVMIPGGVLFVRRVRRLRVRQG